MKHRKLDKHRKMYISSKERRMLHLKLGDPVEITVEYGTIHIRKFDNNFVEKRPFLGIVREMDCNGHVVIPVEFLDTLGIPRNTWYDVEVIEKEHVAIIKII